MAPERFFRHLEGLGDRFVVDLPGLPTLLCTTNPDDVRAIFTDQQGNLRMGEAVRRLAAHEPLVGPEALIFKDGPDHLRERRALNPALRGDRLASYEAAMVAKTERRLAEWPIGRPLRWARMMEELTLDIIMDVVFGVTDHDRLDRLRAAVLHLDRVAASKQFLGQMFVALLLRGRWALVSPGVRRAVEELDSIVLEEIASRRRDGMVRDDILSAFLSADVDGGATLGDRDIARVLRGLLLGGHDTTSMTLSWLAERVIRHPDVLERLQIGVANGDDAYLDATIAETLRLRPIAPFTGRWVVNAFTLGDVEVPPGIVVVPFITLLHRRPDIYPDPLAFNPERFLDERPGRVHLDTVWRRGTPLHRRAVRASRDARGDAHHPQRTPVHPGPGARRGAHAPALRNRSRQRRDRHAATCGVTARAAPLDRLRSISATGRVSSANHRPATPRRFSKASEIAGTAAIARSAIAVIVRLGFTPGLAGTAAPSQTSRFW